MLSLARCRELIGSNSNLSDELLEKLRDDLYGLANVILDGTPPGKLSSSHIPSGSSAGTRHIVESPARYADVFALLPEDDRYPVEERAAIHEFDGGCTREQAEKLALDEYWMRKLTEGADEH